MTEHEHKHGGAATAEAPATTVLKTPADVKKEATTGARAEGSKTPKEPKAPKEPRPGPAPGGLSWMDWFRKRIYTDGIEPKEAEKEYIELRKNEERYAGREKVLTRHAYHHRVLATRDNKAAGGETTAS